MGGGTLSVVAYRGWTPELQAFVMGSRPVYLRPGGPAAQLLAAVGQLDASAPLGEAWVNSLAVTPNLGELMRSLLDRFFERRQDIPSAVRASIREDFSRGEICELEGWRLSETECQLAGLQWLAIQHGLLDATGPEERQAKAYTAGEIAPVKNWGPRHTLRGEVFNPQLDGHSGLWFLVEGAPPHARIMIDGQIAPTSVSEKSVSSGLHGAEQERILAKPGRYEIALVDPIRKTKQVVGHFEVRESPGKPAASKSRDMAFCEVTRWGPQRTRAGVAANEQPDGSMGLWLHTDCLPRGARLWFGEDLLVYHRKPFGLTALLPLALLGAPGKVPLSFSLGSDGEKQVFGHVVIE